MDGRHLRLANPMNPDQALLRASLLPSSLRKAGENLRYFDSFRFFEIGDRYLKGADGVPVEERMLSLVLVPEKGEDAFTSLKGLLSKLSVFARQDDIIWEPIAFETAVEIYPMFHPTRVATLSVNGKTLGEAGELSPSAIKSYGLRGTVVSAQIDFDVLRSLFATTPIFRPLPKFPYANRDFSVTVSNDVRVGDLTHVIAGVSPLLRKAEVFDIFAKGEEKNVAFHLSFGHDDRTVTGEEVDATLTEIIGKTADQFGARLSS